VQAEEDAEPTVALRFGWPAGLDVRVESTEEKTRESDGSSRDARVAMRYRMRTERHDEGLRVSYADYEVLAAPDAPEGSPQARLDTMLQRLGATIPSLVVSPEGALLRLDDLGPLQQQLQSMIDDLLEQAPGIPEGLRTMLRSSASVEALTARAAEDWNLHVGTWHGADFEPGALYELETVEPLPLLNNAELPMRFEFAIEDVLPCHDGADAPQCVLLVMNSAADPDTVRRLISGMLEGMPGSTGFESLEVNNHATLLAEPSTLLPHRLVVEERVEATVREPGGSVQVARQQERRTVVYTYGR
jgi:hypothetical protein